MPTYFVISSRAEGVFAQTDDLEHAGRILGALLDTREDPNWVDYWVRAEDPDNGPEFYWCPELRGIFSAACFVGAKS